MAPRRRQPIPTTPQGVRRPPVRVMGTPLLHVRTAASSRRLLRAICSRR
jgi:hypothetical protein